MSSDPPLAADRGFFVDQVLAEIPPDDSSSAVEAGRRVDAAGNLRAEPVVLSGRQQRGVFDEAEKTVEHADAVP